MSCIVYLSGEIHTDWREQIKRGTDKLVLDISYTSAVTKHDASDAAGDHLGHEDKKFWRDHKSAKVNAIRNKNIIKASIAHRYDENFILSSSLTSNIDNIYY